MKGYLRGGFLLIIMAMLVVTLAWACGGPSPTSTPPPAPSKPPAATPTATPKPTTTPAAREPVTLTIKTGQIGQTGYTIGLTVAKILNQYSTWVKADVVESMGSTAVVKEVTAKPELRQKMLFTGSDATIPLAEKGVPPFAAPYSGQRSIFTFFDGPSGLMTYDPKITSKADLVGKKLFLWQRTMSGGDFLHYIVENAWGLKGKVQITPGGLPDSARALRDGVVDVGHAQWNGFSPTKWVPSDALNQLIAEKPKGLHFIDIPPEDVEAANKVSGYLTHTVTVGPGKLLPDQAQFRSFGIYIGLYADVTMPDDVVYEVTRLVYEHIDVFRQTDPNTLVSKETLGKVGSAGIVHPAAARFYKEKGVPVGL